MIHQDPVFNDLLLKIEHLHIENKIDELKITLDELRTLAENRQDSIGLAATYFYEGILAEGTKFEMIYYNKAAAICQIFHIPYYEMKTQNSLGIVYSIKADFFSSLQCYLKAFHISELHPEFKFEHIILNNLGNLFAWLGEDALAIEYLEQAYDKYIKNEIDDPYVLLVTTINLMECYGKLHNMDKVQLYYHDLNVHATPDEQQTFDCVLLWTEIDTQYALHKEETSPLWLQAHIQSYLRTAALTDDFIYVFRGCLTLFAICLDIHDYSLSKEMLTFMNLRREEHSMDSFDYEFADAKYQFYHVFYKEEEINTEIYFDFYYEQSKHSIHQLKSTYARSLMVQIELDRSLHENTTVREENRKLQKDVEQDPFTGLLNKVSTEKYVTDLLPVIQPNHYHAMFLLDIDYFKSVNDKYGHDHGDIVIVKTAEILKSLSVVDKITGRFGGDEFLLFIPNAASEQEIIQTAQYLNHISASIELPDCPNPGITYSIGIVLISEPIEFDQAFKCSDQALYTAKANGRNQYILIEPDV